MITRDDIQAAQYRMAKRFGDDPGSDHATVIDGDNVLAERFGVEDGAVRDFVEQLTSGLVNELGHHSPPVVMLHLVLNGFLAGLETGRGVVPDSQLPDPNNLTEGS